MVCTYCGSKTHIVNSRHQKRANNVWRRRACRTCGALFTTIEQVDYEKSWVVQYPDGRSEPFIRDKLLISLHKSLQHRPAALTDSLALTATVMAALGGIIHHGTVTDTAIATLVHQTLQRFDSAAATMYGAYHTTSL